jgi:hypothetical protein
MGWSSGAPLTITASNSQITFTPVPGQIAIGATSNTPNILGSFPKSTGQVTKVANGAVYFPDLKQIVDPLRSRHHAGSGPQLGACRAESANRVQQSGDHGQQWKHHPCQPGAGNGRDIGPNVDRGTGPHQTGCRTS